MENEKKPCLVVVSLVKKFASGDEKIRMSGEALNALSERVEKLVQSARVIAIEDGRKTILARDISE